MGLPASCGFSNGVLKAVNVDFRQTNPAQGQVTADGQLLIGSSVAPYIRVASLTSTGSTITITPGHGTLNIEAASSFPSTFTEDSGTATPSSNNLNVEGGTSIGGFATNINTIGSGDTVTVCLNNSISQPDTSQDGSKGLYSLGGTIFLHDFTTFSTGSGPQDGLCTFVGLNAGNLNLTNDSSYCTACGGLALNSVTTASSCTAVGSHAAKSVTSAAFVTAIGESAGKNVTTNGYGTYVGAGAGKNDSGDYDTVVGSLAYVYLENGTTNIAIGYSSMVGSAINPNLNTASYNVCIGSNNLFNVVSSGYCCAIGNNALPNLVTGSYVIALGANAGSNYVGAESNDILIGNTGTVGESNVIRIGTQGGGAGQQNTCYIAGITGVSVSNIKMVTINSATGQLGSQNIPGSSSWTAVNSGSNPITFVTLNGYIPKGAGVVDFMLPAAATIGDTYNIAGYGNLWTVGQNAGQSITEGTHQTTIGVTGSLVASQVRDSCTIVCVETNTEFQIISSVGNLIFN